MTLIIIGIIVVIILAIVDSILESDSPFVKIGAIAAVVAGGFALLGALFDWSFLYTLAKIAVAVIIVTIVVRILIFVFSGGSK